jgi:hypothetical protein
MTFSIETFRIHGGEEIKLFKSPDGKYACPVCGDVSVGGSPYANCRAVVGGVSVGEPGAVGSLDICPVCSTQYGYSDFPFENETQSVNWKWRQLRHEWLRSVEITNEIKMKLKNIDLDPDAEILMARR